MRPQRQRILCRLAEVVTDTERFVTVLGVGPQDYMNFVNTAVRQLLTLGATLHPE